MSLDPLKPGWNTVSPLAQPFVSALNRMRLRETLEPEQLEARAAILLEERFGPGEAAQTAFGRGVSGLLSEHTHYFDGFALVLPMVQGTAIAVRPAMGSISAIVFEKEGQLHSVAQGEVAREGALGIVARLLRGSGRAIEMAVVSTVGDAFREAAETALAFALTGVLYPGASRAERIHHVRAALAGEGRFSAAYPIAAESGRAGTVALVDTRTLEHLPLEISADRVGWGLVAPVGPPQGAGRSGVLQRRADRALAHLQKAGMEIESFRELEHRDLPQALETAAVLHRPTIQYLVTENRRVQNLVGALRRADMQMAGALLLMSFNARRDWGGVSPEERQAVHLIESMTADGLYGATMTGTNPTLVVLGRPFLVPAALDRVSERTQARTGVLPETLLL